MFKYSLGCVAYTAIVFTIDFLVFGEVTIIPGLLLLIMAFSNEVQLLDSVKRLERYRGESAAG